MRAMTVVPGQRGTAGIEEAPDPGMQVGALLGTVNAAGATGNKLSKRLQPPTLGGWAG